MKNENDHLRTNECREKAKNLLLKVKKAGSFCYKRSFMTRIVTALAINPFEVTFALNSFEVVFGQKKFIGSNANNMTLKN